MGEGWAREPLWGEAVTHPNPPSAPHPRMLPALMPLTAAEPPSPPLSRLQRRGCSISLPPPGPAVSFPVPWHAGCSVASGQTLRDGCLCPGTERCSERAGRGALEP